MEEENRIKMTDSKDAKDLPQDVAQQASSAADAAPQTSTSSSGEEPSIQQKVQEAMAQGQESGLLSAEQLQDGSLQDKVKEAMEKGQAPGGILNKFMSGEVNNPLSSYGNSFGNTIQDTLSPVGNVMGKGLEQVGRPVGGAVEPLVGGLMKSGGAFGSALGVGSGNMSKRNAAEAEEREKLKEEIGGKEQSGENPLGL